MKMEELTRKHEIQIQKFKLKTEAEKAILLQKVQQLTDQNQKLKEKLKTNHNSY